MGNQTKYNLAFGIGFTPSISQLCGTTRFNNMIGILNCINVAMYINPPPIEINADYAQTIGRALRERRDAIEESVETIADKLLMSRDQIRGLENYSLKKFYGERHFAQALIKYAAFINIPIQPDELMRNGALAAGEVINETNPEPSPPAEEKPKTRLFQSPAIRAISAVLFASATLSMVGLIIYTQLDSILKSDPYEHVQTSHNNAVSTAETTVAEAHAPDPKDISSQTTEPDPYVLVETTHQTWIQLNFSNGQVTQKTYPANTKLSFERGELRGLIIGNLNTANLRLNGEKIALASYQKPDSNVARILGKDGQKLLGD